MFSLFPLSGNEKLYLSMTFEIKRPCHALSLLDTCCWHFDLKISGKASMQWVENAAQMSPYFIVCLKNIATPCEPCKCVLSLMHNAIGNILKPIGMLCNARSVQRQNTLKTQYIPINHYTDADTSYFWFGEVQI